MLRAFLAATALAVLTTSVDAQITMQCFPGTGGVVNCPCPSQPPSNVSGGCRNHGAMATTGAVLNGSGLPDISDDLIVPQVFITTSNHRPIPSGVLNVFWSYKPGSATPTLGHVSGAGVRCTGAGGNFQRVYIGQVFGGLTVPDAGNPALSASLSSRALVGPPSLPIVPGETRHYFNVYRDPQAAVGCGNSTTTTNTTNMLSIVWTD